MVGGIGSLCSGGLGDRQGDQLVGEPGIRHEVSGLVEAFKDMLRPCRSLD